MPGGQRTMTTFYKYWVSVSQDEKNCSNEVFNTVTLALKTSLLQFFSQDEKNCSNEVFKASVTVLNN